MVIIFITHGYWAWLLVKNHHLWLLTTTNRYWSYLYKVVALVAIKQPRSWSWYALHSLCTQEILTTGPETGGPGRKKTWGPRFSTGVACSYRCEKSTRSSQPLRTNRTTSRTSIDHNSQAASSCEVGWNDEWCSTLRLVAYALVPTATGPTDPASFSRGAHPWKKEAPTFGLRCTV